MDESITFEHLVRMAVQEFIDGNPDALLSEMIGTLHVIATDLALAALAPDDESDAE